MHGNQLSYAETFDKALAGLYGDAAAPGSAAPGAPPSQAEPFGELARRAGRAFDDYLQALADKRFDEAGAALERLSGALKKLEGRSSGRDHVAERDRPAQTQKE